MNIFHSFLLFLLIFSGFLVFFVNNPIHSVLFLILCFCEAASILFLFNVEFIALLFIIIYVGAIAVLFLFVVMMLDVKLNISHNFNNTPVLFFLIFIAFLQLFFYIKQVINNLPSDTLVSLNTYNFDHLNNIDIFGQVLYNYYVWCFLIAGLVLLIAMIGAIVLTLTFKSQRKNELVFRQLSSSEKAILHFR